MDAFQMQRITEWVSAQRRSEDIILLDPVQEDIFHIPWPELKIGPDGGCIRLLPSAILAFLKSRKLLWTCFCFSADPLGHPVAEFVEYENDQVRVYCANRINPCGFHLNLNRIYLRSEISFEFDAFQAEQSYEEFNNAMLEMFRIDQENDIIEGWFGTYDAPRSQDGVKRIPL
ncbi:hypothetical protein H1R20_g2739, partial [Candolleomyces eurysporus]